MTERITNKKSLDVYSLKEFGELMDMDRQTIMKYIRSGELKTSKVGNKYYFTRDDIMQFLELHRVN